MFLVTVNEAHSEGLKKRNNLSTDSGRMAMYA